jgi:hypothetical protein
MPARLGTLDLAKITESASTINGYKTDALTLKGAQVLEVRMEVDDDPADALLPRTMHPAIPAYAIFSVTHYPESPWGDFAVAEVRIAGRTGVRPRGFVLRSYVNNEEAARQLAARWGFPVAAGDVTVGISHDRVTGRVKLAGKTVLEIEESDRDSISGSDIQFIASMHLARNKEDDKLVVVQIDPEFVFSKAERGSPRVLALDNDAFGAGNSLRVTNPISAYFATMEVKLPKIRYICDPELPAMQGTTKVAA